MWTEQNYANDSRVVNASYQRRFNSGFDIQSMMFTFQKGEATYILPAKMEVCYTCDGRGTHVNPSIDAGGISCDDDFWQDDYDDEGNSLYHEGFYDVTCGTCAGKNVVAAVDRQRADKATLAIWDDHCDEDDYCEAISRAERRMGA